MGLEGGSIGGGERKRGKKQVWEWREEAVEVERGREEKEQEWDLREEALEVERGEKGGKRKGVGLERGSIGGRERR